MEFPVLKIETIDIIVTNDLTKTTRREFRIFLRDETEIIYQIDYLESVLDNDPDPYMLISPNSNCIHYEEFYKYSALEWFFMYELLKPKHFRKRDFPDVIKISLGNDHEFLASRFYEHFVFNEKENVDKDCILQALRHFLTLQREIFTLH